MNVLRNIFIGEIKKTIESKMRDDEAMDDEEAFKEMLYHQA